MTLSGVIRRVSAGERRDRDRGSLRIETFEGSRPRLRWTRQAMGIESIRRRREYLLGRRRECGRVPARAATEAEGSFQSSLIEISWLRFPLRWDFAFMTLASDVTDQ
jgi:hypothetical protein